MGGDMTKMKIREIREKYEKGDVIVHRWETPRAGNHISSPTSKTQEREARKQGKNTIKPLSMEEVLWEIPLDEELNFNLFSSETRSLLTKNVMCDIEVVEE